MVLWLVLVTGKMASVVVEKLVEEMETSFLEMEEEMEKEVI
jgi:hypothetical protein